MKNIPPLQGSAVVITSAAFVFLLTGIVSNQLIFPVEFIPYIWMSLIALISTVIAIGFFWLGVVLIGPTKGTIISTLEPVVTVFLAYFFLGETLSLLQIFGGLLILAGVVIIRFNFDFSKILYNDFGSKKTL